MIKKRCSRNYDKKNEFISGYYLILYNHVKNHVNFEITIWVVVTRQFYWKFWIFIYRLQFHPLIVISLMQTYFVLSSLSKYALEKTLFVTDFLNTEEIASLYWKIGGDLIILLRSGHPIICVPGIIWKITTLHSGHHFWEEIASILEEIASSIFWNDWSLSTFQCSNLF